jgi:hypothetical protein
MPSSSPLTQLPRTVTGAEARYVRRTRASSAAAIGRLVLHGKLMRLMRVTASRKARGSMHSNTAAAGPLQALQQHSTQTAAAEVCQTSVAVIQ